MRGWSVYGMRAEYANHNTARLAMRCKYAAFQILRVGRGCAALHSAPCLHGAEKHINYLMNTTRQAHT